MAAPAGRLLGAQGDERVDAYRASRGDITGHEGHTEEQRCNAHERCRIEGAHARDTKLSMTRFAPALSKSTESLLPSTALTRP